jgi:branched-chain amino acid transport system substrate-binding protein
MLVLFFDILWWVIPAINLNTTLKIFVWKPIEKSTGNEIPGLLISTVSFIIIALASFGVLAFVFDMKVTGLLATSGMLAAIIGLALQMNLSNIISGITISLEKPFKIGDWVKIGDLEGKVLETNWRTTRLETRDESVMCVPNSVVSDSHIHNYHYPDDLFLLDLQVQIDLTHRPERVEKILLDAVLDIENILKEPAPSIDIAIGPWSVNYTITFAVRDYERRDEYLTLAWKYVWNHLYRAGISLASERQQIEMVKRPPVIRDGLCDSTTLIMDIDIFSPFKRDEVLALLEKVKTRSYKSRETIIRQGDDGDSLFIILEGTVEIWIQIAEGRDLEVARMGPGKFFGEMSLLTGEARTATVISTTNSRLIEITKDDFAPLVASYPTFAEELSKILIQRKQANQASSEGANPGANDQAARHLINQIRGFFA